MPSQGKFPITFPFIFDDYRRWIEFTAIEDSLNFEGVRDSVAFEAIPDTIKFTEVETYG